MMTAMFAVIVFYAWRRQEALEEVQRSAERERDFIRDVSHYLRTPITVATGHAELIRAGSTDEQLAEDSEIVLEELRRVSTISDRLLLLASAEDDRFLRRDDVDVGRLVRTTWKRWKAAAERDWKQDVSEEGTVPGDAERLALALDCLVENAVKATCDGGTIVIRARREGDAVLLEASDDGVGVPLEDQQRILERFERTPGKERSSGGAGLGLALARAIAEGHEGSLEVESEPGEGATFRIRLHGFRPREPLATSPVELEQEVDVVPDEDDRSALARHS